MHMNVVIGTALFPPDTEASAHYVKELARRLADTHAVTVIAYGRIPESVPNATVIAVDKRAPLPLRLIRFGIVLWRAVKNADVLIMENGPSVELPASIVTYAVKKPLIIHRGDRAARERAAQYTPLRMIERIAARSATATITDMPLPRPETVPFTPRPEAARAAYEVSWREHITHLTTVLEHAAQ